MIITKEHVFAIIGFTLIAFTLFLLFCDLDDNPLYNLVKPTVEDRYYTLNNQYVGDIEDEGTLYTNCLIFNVQPLNNGLNAAGSPTKLYLAGEHITRTYFKNGEIIVVTWVYQIDGINRISSITPYNFYTNATNINFLFVN